MECANDNILGNPHIEEHIVDEMDVSGHDESTVMEVTERNPDYFESEHIVVFHGTGQEVSGMEWASESIPGISQLKEQNADEMDLSEQDKAKSVAATENISTVGQKGPDVFVPNVGTTGRYEEQNADGPGMEWASESIPRISLHKEQNADEMDLSEQDKAKSIAATENISTVRKDQMDLITTC
ncbi:hypothetical protein E2562_034589 [Oryza meyeriana var. granulata]|uniref:Uncharacterized protein n=1 Tax=Oryza meyeriana var. granulata TaxID=110450 RepID=A0A6G1DSY5_9ORYZ|nr:hypothetical protein E2562_034589 [Oryza meyeriana var. granulata]